MAKVIDLTELGKVTGRCRLCIKCSTQNHSPTCLVLWTLVPLNKPINRLFYPFNSYSPYRVFFPSLFITAKVIDLAELGKTIGVLRGGAAVLCLAHDCLVEDAGELERFVRSEILHSATMALVALRRGLRAQGKKRVSSADACLDRDIQSSPISARGGICPPVGYPASTGSMIISTIAELETKAELDAYGEEVCDDLSMIFSRPVGGNASADESQTPRVRAALQKHEALLSPQSICALTALLSFRGGQFLISSSNSKSAGGFRDDSPSTGNPADWVPLLSDALLAVRMASLEHVAMWANACDPVTVESACNAHGSALAAARTAPGCNHTHMHMPGVVTAVGEPARNTHASAVPAAGAESACSTQASAIAAADAESACSTQALAVSGQAESASNTHASAVAAGGAESTCSARVSTVAGGAESASNTHVSTVPAEEAAAVSSVEGAGDDGIGAIWAGLHRTSGLGLSPLMLLTATLCPFDNTPQFDTNQNYGEGQNFTPEGSKGVNNAPPVGVACSASSLARTLLRLLSSQFLGNLFSHLSKRCQTAATAKRNTEAGSDDHHLDRHEIDATGNSEAGRSGHYPDGRKIGATEVEFSDLPGHPALDEFSRLDGETVKSEARGVIALLDARDTGALPPAALMAALQCGKAGFRLESRQAQVVLHLAGGFCASPL